MTATPAGVVAAEVASVASGARPPLAVVVVPGVGLGLACGDRSWSVPAADPVPVIATVEERVGPRWVWWSAARTAAPVAAARLGACWDLGATHQLLHGGWRVDPAAVWAAYRGLPEPPPPSAGEVTLLDLAADADSPADGPAHGPTGGPLPAGDPLLRADGQLRRSWAVDDWDPASRDDVDHDTLLRLAARWASLALEVRAAHEQSLLRLPDPRPSPTGTPLAVLVAHAESAAALLGVELEAEGLPVHRPVAEALIAAQAGPRPADAEAERAARGARDAVVLRHFPGDPVDLRNPAQVREMLRRAGIDVPDTRSWRLEGFAATHPGVAALLAWRKAERIATTYGYGWLDAHVGADGRLRGRWTATDGGAGRMTAQAGLHNMPAELRPAVVAEPGHVLVRADLGQVEPRVLATVSGDPALVAATADDDLYTPVAEQLRCDRPTAKVAVLAAMYGQTSGAAGQALRRMERAYPRALAYLRRAEEHGRAGVDTRTYGGRLIRLTPPVDDADEVAVRADEVTAAEAGEARVEAAWLRARGRYARNAVVQGAAAELFKAWAATVRAGLARLDGRVVLCLHDELLLHVPEEHADEAAALATQALAGTVAWWASGSRARFVVDVSVVRRWSDAKG